MRVTLAVVMPFRFTVAFEKVQIRALGAAHVSATVLLNPFTDPRLSMAVPVLPDWMATLGVSVEKLKSVGSLYDVVNALADPA